MQDILKFFNHPFFSIIGGLTTLLMFIGFCLTVFFVIKGVFPVWYRLGMGLSKRKIAIFADYEYESLKNMLIDSNLFKKKNIKQIEKKDLKNAENYSLFLLHWKYIAEDIDKVLSLKKHTDALIVYAPRNEGQINVDIMNKINNECNSIVVNLRGRLLNDILTCMITTSYSKK